MAFPRLLFQISDGWDQVGPGWDGPPPGIEKLRGPEANANASRLRELSKLSEWDCE
jgi:hypothetical protein